jgi:hypothetical protein
MGAVPEQPYHGHPAPALSVLYKGYASLSFKSHLAVTYGRHDAVGSCRGATYDGS